MRSRLVALLTLSLLAGSLSACADATSSDPSSSSADRQGPTGESKLALAADVKGDTDIAGMRFEIEQVACSNPPFDQAPQNPVSASKVTDFEDAFLPAGLDVFEKNPFDPQSEHIFADGFFQLAAGCYDATATPLNSKGQRSDDCRKAKKKEIRVKDGKTIERTMVVQCPGEPRGALDVVAGVNHEPEIRDLEYKPSKIGDSCWPTQICATVEDPDNDPIEFVWDRIGGPKPMSGPTVASTTKNEDGSVTQCVDIRQGDKGTYKFRVRAWDLAWKDKKNKKGKKMVRIEELLKDQAQPKNKKARSHDMQEFPLHATKKCPARGRTVTTALTMKQDKDGFPTSEAETYLKNVVDWINPTIDPDPTIYLLVDDNRHGEDLDDPQWIKDRLNNAGFSDVRIRKEENLAGDQNGLSVSDLRSLDPDPQVVLHDAIGFPFDDKKTFNSLLTYRDVVGGGLALFGDDVTHTAAGSGIASMEPLTFMEYQGDNGTTPCGVNVDNNAGPAYEVQLSDFDSPPQAPQPVLQGGLDGLTFDYSNDLDRNIRASEGERLLGNGSFSAPECEGDPVMTDVITAVDAATLSP